MKSHACWSAALVAACALAAALGYLLTDRLPRPGGSLPDAQRLSLQLDGKLAGVRQSRAAKEAITAEVIAGRRTLFEAAAAFRALDEGNPDFSREVFRRCHRGGSDDERFCRMVIVYAEGILSHHPASEAEQALARLEVELEAHLRAHGSVTLPPVAFTE